MRVSVTAVPVKHLLPMINDHTKKTAQPHLLFKSRERSLILNGYSGAKKARIFSASKSHTDGKIRPKQLFGIIQPFLLY